VNDCAESISLGIDLASQPKNTAACRIHWRKGRGSVELIRDELHDTSLLGLIRDPQVGKVAIDAPFGWPTEFVDALVAWRERGTWPDEPDHRCAQQSMVLRATDRKVKDEVERTPLSVSTNWIAFAAMRCARLLAAIGAEAGQVDRAGEGRILEAYPEAALRRWKVRATEQPGGYKGTDEASRKRRAELVDRLLEETCGWLDVDSATRQTMLDNDDELDAFVCALVARAAELGKLEAVTDPARAAAEGWIRLPCGRLTELGG
jgi:hypothetical protein